MTTKEKDAIREMMQTEGWKIFSASLKEREEALMEGLLYCKEEEFLVNQAQIKALREVVRKPKTLLEGDQDAGKES
jgi:hypothetical protein